MVGSRLTALDVWDAESESYIPIDPSATYTLATNSFLANGGDDFAVFAEALDRYDSGWLLSDALAEYLDTLSPVAPGIEERITQLSLEEGGDTADAGDE